jgi:hypothetical protein
MATHRVQLVTTARAANLSRTEAVTDLMCERRGESLAVFVSGVAPGKCIAQLSKGVGEIARGEPTSLAELLCVEPAPAARSAHGTGGVGSSISRGAGTQLGSQVGCPSAVSGISSGTWQRGPKTG